MGETVARAPRVGVTVARRPEVAISVAPRPRPGETGAAAGSVPPRVSVKLRQSLVVDLPDLTASATGVPAVSQQVLAEIRHFISVEQAGGSYASNINVDLTGVNAATAQSASASQDVVVSLSLAMATQATSADAYSPMGMEKSVAQTLSSSVWTKSTGMVSRSGYVVTPVDNELVAQKPGTYMMHARETRTGSNSSTQCRVQRSRGGTVSTVALSGTGADVMTLDQAVAVEVGDRFWLESYGVGAGTSTRVVTAGSANTYLYFDAP